jgi:hypothetical protein
MRIDLIHMKSISAQPRFSSIFSTSSAVFVPRVIEQGQFTLRDMYEQFQNVMKLGPLNKVSLHVYPSLHCLLIKLLIVKTSDPQPAHLKTRRPVAEQRSSSPTCLGFAIQVMGMLPGFPQYLLGNGQDQDVRDTGRSDHTDTTLDQHAPACICCTTTT